VEHDLSGKTVSTFPDHALGVASRGREQHIIRRGGAVLLQVILASILGSPDFRPFIALFPQRLFYP
jgi:hypothetical protein